jgi:hypothetical protein
MGVSNVRSVSQFFTGEKTKKSDPDAEPGSCLDSWSLVQSVKPGAIKNQPRSPKAAAEHILVFLTALAPRQSPWGAWAGSLVKNHRSVNCVFMLDLQAPFFEMGNTPD